MNFRTRLIQMMVEINEGLIFYPKLKKFYSDKLFNTTPTIIDVGSNKGQSIDFFLKINSQCEIFAFEPNTSLFNKLQEKYKNNPKITLNNLGISSKAGKLLFQENVMDETSTFEKLNYDSDYLKKKAKVLGVSVENIIVDSYEVEVITLSDFIKNHPNIFIDVLKIDVEGHEYDCLLGLFQQPLSKYPIKYIQLESHNDDMYLSHKNHTDIVEILRANGFEEVNKIKHGFGDFHEIIYANTQYP